MRGREHAALCALYDFGKAPPHLFGIITAHFHRLTSEAFGNEGRIVTFVYEAKVVGLLVKHGVGKRLAEPADSYSWACLEAPLPARYFSAAIVNGSCGARTGLAMALASGVGAGSGSRTEFSLSEIARRQA